MRKTLLALLLATAGCAELPPVKTTLDVATIRVSKEQPLGSPDVGMALAVVTPDNVQSHRDLMVTARWRGTDHSQVFDNRNGIAPTATVMKSAEVPLVPLPAFLVRLVNRTDVPISFEHARFALKDDLGHSYDIYDDAGAVTGRVTTDFSGSHEEAGSNPQLIEWLANIVGRLTFLNRSTKIPAHGDFQGILVFKLKPRDLAELNDFLGAVGNFTVEITGAAGPPNLTLMAKLDKTEVPLSMTCPGGTTPTVKACKLP